MSLKDELNARVRKYRLKNPAPSPEEIDAEAKACAARQWKKLRKKFLLCQKKDKGVIIFVGTIGNLFTYKEGDFLFGHPWTQFGRIRYYPETMKWLRRMAEEEGLRVIENYSGSVLNGIYDPSFVCWRYAFAYDKPSNSEE